VDAIVWERAFFKIGAIEYSYVNDKMTSGEMGVTGEDLQNIIKRSVMDYYFR